MLSILWNRNNFVGIDTQQSFIEKLEGGIGLSADIPVSLRMEFSKIAPVCLYDTGLSLDTASDASLANARNAAKELAADTVMLSAGYTCDIGQDESSYLERLTFIKAFFAEEHICLWLTNRRPYLAGKWVSSTKLLRLCQTAQVRIAHDIGASHAELHAMENYYDWRPETAALLLNDNLGAHAALYVGHSLYNPLSVIDGMYQPGWGSAPFVAILKDVKQNMPSLPLFLNGVRHQNAPLEIVWKELNALMEGNVYISPAGGRFGRNEYDRLLIKKRN